MTALVGLRTRLRLARLAIVVPPERSGPEAADFAAHGADLLIFTRGDRSVEEAAEAISVARKRLFGLQTIVATDDFDVAEKCLADVLYLRRPGWRPFGYKRPHEHALIGRSIDHADDGDKIDGDPFDFGFLGPAVVDGQAGPEIVEMNDLHPATALPAGPLWFAAGGITPDNVGEVIAAGARRVVVSTSIFNGVDDPFATTKAIADQLADAWKNDPGARAYGEDAFDSDGPRHPQATLRPGPTAQEPPAL